MIVLIACIHLLLIFEAMTGIARIAGYSIGAPEIGYSLQMAMSVLSRTIMLIFMPLVGLMADNKTIAMDYVTLLQLFALPVCLSMVYKFQSTILRFLIPLGLSVRQTGTMFGCLNFKNIDQIYQAKIDNDRISKIIKKIKFKKIIFFKFYMASFIPLYIAWPTILILLDRFHDDRAFVIGMVTWLTAISTILLTLYIDPVLAKIGRNKNVVIAVYSLLVLERIKASLISVFLIFIFKIFIEESWIG